MDLLQWSDKMSVGVDVLDEDHKKLIALINELAESVRKGGDHETVSKVLDELVDYTKYHFKREEAWQEKAGFPDVERHKEIHEDLTEQVVEIQEDFQESYRDSLSKDVMVFLSDWLKKHIMGEDKKYVEYVKQVEAPEGV